MSTDKRYQIERLPPRERPGKTPIPGPWAIRDTATGKLVEQPDERGRAAVVLFSMDDSALAWISNNRYVTRGDSDRP
ncbi:hypothetical protein GCM10010193_56450 [Kitasatospora atroaurantiaca]|uniref:Uncharacterized protein n=1 Tax=Kitasatospora atroaurantiaca TaxID=285545 RepID=A0A561EMP4_9ACTN|nr:hypothetical protein [Kitasatospora atroaurantiaca]TWE16896.1 hypothetical protein FB465_1890 [Kitasatospora atroaurantiaca]